MAKQAAVAESKPGLVAQVQTFYQEVMSEMSKVTWPSQEDLKANTSVVLVLLAIMGAIIYVMDMIFGKIVVFVFSLV